MRRTLSTAGLALVTLLAWCGRLEAADKSPEPIRAAAVYDGHLLCLGDGGEVAAWDVKKWEHQKEAGRKFTRKGLVRLAADGDTLWAVDDATLYRWSAKGGEWEKLAGFDADKESVVAVVPVGGVPFVVLPSQVVEPVGKKAFKAPDSKLPKQGVPLRILATHGTDSMLWIGTGSGEWGGRLLGLDPKGGKWVEERDLGEYVTGITHVEKDEVAVAWSMSHFSAHTQLRVHKADATAKTEHPRLEDRYYQRLAYSPFDKLLYAVEADELVTVADGKPTAVGKLKGEVLEREPDAMGAAPGLLELIPVGEKAVVVVPKAGHPWLVRKGEVTVLRAP